MLLIRLVEESERYLGIGLGQKHSLTLTLTFDPKYLLTFLQYALDGLRDLCDRLLYTGCDNENATDMLFLAQQHNLHIAAKEISMFIKR